MPSETRRSFHTITEDELKQLATFLENYKVKFNHLGNHLLQPTQHFWFDGPYDVERNEKRYFGSSYILVRPRQFASEQVDTKEVEIFPREEMDDTHLSCCTLISWVEKRWVYELLVKMNQPEKPEDEVNELQ